MKHSTSKKIYTETTSNVGLRLGGRPGFKPALAEPKQLNLNKLGDAGGFKDRGCRRRPKPTFEVVSVYHHFCKERGKLILVVKKVVSSLFLKKIAFSFRRVVIDKIKRWVVFTCASLGISWAKKLKKKIPDLTLVGYLKSADGIGRLPIEVINLLGKDLSVNFCSTRINSYRDVPSQVKDIARRPVYNFGKVVLFQDSLTCSNLKLYKAIKFHGREKQIKISYSMFEAKELPGEWVEVLNRYFDAVVIPDPYLEQLYYNSGVKTPIFTLPIGLDLSDFMAEPLKRKKNTPFVFANFSSITERKNHCALVQAFADAFGNSEEVVLLLSGRYAEIATMKKIRKIIVDRNLKNVTLSLKEMARREYVCNFKAIDCFISVSKGEGFSIQPREAMALGIPVILSRNTAHITICDSGLVEQIPSCLESVKGDDQGKYYSCNINDIKNALINVYTNYSSFLENGTKMRNWALQYDHLNMKPFYRTLVKPKDVLYSDLNMITKDILITNSKMLYSKYTQES